jgi:cysteinyl-tRNA synthetase
MSKEKMSKSLGNVFNAREILSRFGGEVARYLLLSVQYRTVLDFNEETIEQALTGLTRIYEAKQKAIEISGIKRARPDLRAESVWGSFAASCESARKEIDDCYANDFNTAGALGALFGLIREFNRALAEPMATATPSATIGATELIRIIEEDIGGIIGVGRREPTQFHEELERIRATRLAASGIERMTAEEIQEAIQQRKDARARKDFPEADRIRKELESKGVLLKDGPQGTTWEYR